MNLPSNPTATPTPDPIPDPLSASIANPILDRTLAHLANTQPAPDLNARLLLRLKAQAPAQATRNRQPRWAWLLSVPTVVAAAVLLALLLPHATLFPHPPTPTSPHHSQLKNSPLATEQTTQPTQEPPNPPQTPSKLKISKLTAEQEKLFLPPPAITPGRKAPITTEAETQALNDLQAPSHPAPPLPLTAQERSILHLLRRDGTVELAQLDPALQTKLFELQQTNFQQFFDPPPPPKFEGEIK